MLISHKGKMPQVHPSAYIAPTATICGDVEIGPNCRVMHGASIIAEGDKGVKSTLDSFYCFRHESAMAEHQNWMAKVGKRKNEKQ